MSAELRILDRDEFIARASYDLDVAQERRSKKMMEKPTKPSLAERAKLYNTARAEGANPDEAAQAAGWKNLNTARACCNKGGIKLSTKAPTTDETPPSKAPAGIEETYTFTDATPPRKAATINQDFEAAFPMPDKPVMVNETVVVANETPVLANEPAQNADKPVKACTLRPCCWFGKDFVYFESEEYIEIKPKNGESIQLTPVALKQFSEELKELLEIIK